MNHPQPTQLIDFATGRMDPTLRCLLEAHLRFCDACMGKVRDVPGLPPAEIPDREVSPADQALLDRARDGLRRRLAAATVPGVPAGAPPELLRIADGASSPESWVWQGNSSGTFRIAPILRDPVAGHVLLCAYLRPGAEFPAHRHLWPEILVLLSGEFRSGEVSHGPGDWCESEPGSIHRQTAGPGECWALVRLERPRDSAAERADGKRIPGIVFGV
jgi:anti-sigma factor ChrR (cupin superfamily)